MMQMALSNAVHPEYGVVTISFPIPEEEYGHCLELLEALEIGNAVNRDCKVQEVQDGPPILKRLEGSRVNLDELDYLAKRLDSFTDQELAQFQSAAVSYNYSNSPAQGTDRRYQQERAHRAEQVQREVHPDKSHVLRPLRDRLSPVRLEQGRSETGCVAVRKPPGLWGKIL